MVCPSPGDMRVLDWAKRPVTTQPTRLKGGADEPISTLALVHKDAWIAMAKGDTADIPLVTKTFLERDIRPDTAYTMTDLEPDSRHNADALSFRNKEGKSLTVVYNRYSYRMGTAKDNNENWFLVSSNYNAEDRLSCNSSDKNLTYKSVIPFKIQLKNEFGEEYESPLFILTVVYIIQPEYLDKAPGFRF